MTNSVAAAGSGAEVGKVGGHVRGVPLVQLRVSLLDVPGERLVAGCGILAHVRGMAEQPRPRVVEVEDPDHLFTRRDEVVRGVVAVDDHLGIGQRRELPRQVAGDERYGRVVEAPQQPGGRDERGLAAYGL